MRRYEETHSPYSRPEPPTPNKQSKKHEDDDEHHPSKSQEEPVHPTVNDFAPLTRVLAHAHPAIFTRSMANPKPTTLSIGFTTYWNDISPSEIISLLQAEGKLLARFKAHAKNDYIPHRATYYQEQKRCNMSEEGLAAEFELVWDLILEKEDGAMMLGAMKKLGLMEEAKEIARRDFEGGN